MKRMHIGLSVADVDASIEFYTRLFGQPPTLHRGSYAKWMLDDPYINFNINGEGDGEPGTVSHLGIQVDSSDDVATRAGRTPRFNASSISVFNARNSLSAAAVSSGTSSNSMIKSSAIASFMPG